MKRKKILILIFLGLILILTTSLTLGKYVYNSVWNYYLTSKNFYFESDLLDNSNRNNSFLKWGGEEIYFSIKNSSNNELVSDYDISYKITCSVLGDEAEYIECVLNDTESSAYNGKLSNISYCLAEAPEDKDLNKTDCEIKGYKWYDEPIKKDNYFNLKLTDEAKEINEVSVKIVAESTSPYHKTLSGVFNLKKIDKMQLEYDLEYEKFIDYDNLLIINKTNNAKCFLIEFNSNDYLIDVDNNLIKEKEYNDQEKISKIIVEVPSESSFNYNFYKLNIEKDYTINDFSIKEKEC